MEGRLTRRDFLKVGGGALGGAYIAALATPGSALAQDEEGKGWAKVPGILRRINPPEFPDREFVITEYGAIGDGETDCTEAFRRAIEECTGSGGGHVVVPEGVFLSGPIHLANNVDLHVEEAGTIRFSRAPGDYLPQVYTRWEGVEVMNYSPLIYGRGLKNIGITGSGTIDGRASNDYWWPWKGQEEHGWEPGDPSQDEARDRLIQMAEDGVPVEERVFGEGDYLRPMMIQPYECENIIIEGVTLKDSPMWHIHPVLSKNITVRGVTVDNPTGPNADGCDPESCTDIHIQSCLFDTGDDCVAFKAGKNADGRRIDTPTKNAVVEDCEMRDGHGGVTMGSEMTGGVENIFARNCVMDSPHLDRVLRIKTNSLRGGYVKNVYMKNVRVSEAAEAIRINFLYGDGEEAGSYNPSVSNIYVRNLRVENTEYALDMRGYEESPIRNVRLKNCVFENVERENRLENVSGLVLSNVVIGDERYHTPSNGKGPRNKR
ncbi:MAG: glycoside hydrolase family 28 protein [Rubrobacter sp.]|nr:glycoside hydrolase family 28 protein [Rubrobacter sp.]